MTYRKLKCKAKLVRKMLKPKYSPLRKRGLFIPLSFGEGSGVRTLEGFEHLLCKTIKSKCLLADFA
jgi:hypothetical protein